MDIDKNEGLLYRQPGWAAKIMLACERLN